MPNTGMGELLQEIDHLELSEEELWSMRESSTRTRCALFMATEGKRDLGGHHEGCGAGQRGWPVSYEPERTKQALYAQDTHKWLTT